MGKEGGSRNAVGLGLLLHKERERGVYNVNIPNFSSYIDIAIEVIILHHLIETA